MAKSKKPALSRGLAEIFGDDFSSVLDDIQEGNNSEYQNSKTEIDVDLIRRNPYQPRKHFDETKLNELADSIREHGVFTPILVKKSGEGYELIAGERRLKASIIANKKTIPAIVMDFDDRQMMEIALLENVQREDLNAIEEALGYQKLIDNLNYTQDELAKRIGKSREHVTNMLRLLKLPKVIQDSVVEGKLSMGHARCLLSLKDEQRMIEVGEHAIKEGLSVRALEKLVKKLLNQQPKKVVNKDKDQQLVAVEERLTQRFQSRVSIDNKTIRISYENQDELNRIIEMLGGLEEEL